MLLTEGPHVSGSLTSRKNRKPRRLCGRCSGLLTLAFVWAKGRRKVVASGFHSAPLSQWRGPRSCTVKNREVHRSSGYVRSLDLRASWSACSCVLRYQGGVDRQLPFPHTTTTPHHHTTTPPPHHHNTSTPTKNTTTPQKHHDSTKAPPRHKGTTTPQKQSPPHHIHITNAKTPKHCNNTTALERPRGETHPLGPTCARNCIQLVM